MTAQPTDIPDFDEGGNLPPGLNVVHNDTGEPEPLAPAPGGDAGYPRDTPLSEMTTEQQAAYWKAKARKHEATWQSVIDKNLTPEQVLAMQERLAEAERAALTDHERAVADARQEGRAEGVRESATATAKSLLRLALRSAQKDISDDELDRFVALTNVSALVTEDGGVDEDMVLEAVKYRTAGRAEPGSSADMGQGRRGEAAAPSGISAGAAIYQQTRGKSIS